MESIPLIGSALFGGGKTTTQSSSKPVDMQAPQFTALRNPFAGVLGMTLAGGPGGFDPRTFGPAPTAQFGGAEADMLDYLNSITAGVGSLPRRMELANTVSGAYLPGASGGNPFMNAVIEASVAPLIMAQNRELGRRIPGAFAAAGHQLGAGGSSPYQRSQGEAAFLSQRAIGDVASQIAGSMYESERGRMIQGLQLDQSEVDRAIQAFQQNAVPRLISQHGIDAGLASGTQMLQQWLQAMSLAAGVTAPVLGNVSSSSGESTNMGKGIFGSLFPQGIFNPAPR